MKLLIIQNKRIGDVLMASVIANNLKRINSEIEVHFLCPKKSVGILQNNPNIDKIFLLPKILHIRNIFSIYKVIKEIRKQEYNFLLDTRSEYFSFLISFLIRAKTKYGFRSKYFNKIYSEVFDKIETPITQTCTALENQLIFLLPFLKENQVPINPQAKIFLSEEEILKARQKMKNNGFKFNRPVIMINVFGATSHLTWPMGNMAKLLDYIWMHYRADLLLNYHPSRKDKLDEMISLLNPNTVVISKPVGQNIREFAALMENCSLIIGNEGAPINIAKALMKPSFSIFSPFISRKNWACYENTNLHQSVHLQDYLPNLNQDFEPYELYKDSSKLYLMLTVEVVADRLNGFLKKQTDIF